MAARDAPDIAKFYNAPESKRGMARVMALLAGLLVTWLAYSLVRDWGVRAEKGIPPNYGSVVMCVAPLMLLVVGIWIGWGHTRVDLGRLTVQRRPLGLPFPSKTRPLSDARRLYVGFHRGPRVVQTASATVQHEPRAYWFVELQGDDFRILLVHQRPRREEALAFAEHIGERAGLPVEVTKQA